MFHDLKLQLAVQACSSHPFLWPCVLFMEPDWNNSSAEMCWSACGLHQPKPELNTDAEMWQGYLLLVSEPLVEDKILCQSLIWTRQRDGEKKKHLFYWCCIIQPQCLKPFFSVFQWCHLLHTTICDICDGPTHHHIVSSSGGVSLLDVRWLNPWRCSSELSAVCVRVVTSCHSCSSALPRAEVIKGRHSPGGDVTRCAPVTQSGRYVRSENKRLL